MNQEAKKPAKLQAVKGMNDFFAEEAGLLQALEAKLHGWLASYGYRNVRTPVLEQTALFRRGIGEVTDIVEKEMFSFTDRLNGDELTMRPEFTAGIVRAVVEHSLLYNGPQRVFSMGPVFRHERPQRGRYRQFHQIDVEALGFAGPDVDAELIVMLKRLWDDLGLTDVRLEINTLGSPAERAAHRDALITYFESHADLLDEDAKRRLHSNPLRILDTKNPAMQAMVNAAPRLDQHLGDESRAHFEELQAYLRDAGIAYTINPRLVRGLDYYNLTVFEWITDQLGAQGTICGGGRYDGLIELFGGKSEPAVGFAIGVERLIDLVKQSGAVNGASRCDVYVVHQGTRPEAARYAFGLAEQMRSTGLEVILHCGGGSFKSQMKKADGSGAEFAVIIGDDELAAQEATLKPLRGDAPQERVKAAALAARLIEQFPEQLPEQITEQPES
ncbi:MAG: histidine--tRNA ligase [Betaproteobacteria bacterium]|nr:histidine--tRNA ligase [Betaproteobacteria bacterium]